MEPEAKAEGDLEQKPPPGLDAEAEPKVQPKNEAESEPVEAVAEPKTPTGPIPDIKIEDTSAGEESKTTDADEKVGAAPGEEFAEHLFPSVVDTTLVQDDIVRVSRMI